MNKITILIVTSMMLLSAASASSNKTLAKALKKFVQSERGSGAEINLGDIVFRSNSPAPVVSSVSKSKKGTGNKIINLAKQKLGQKYVWGAVGQKGTFDCSGLTKYVYQKNGINIPRTSLNQSKHGKYIARSQLRPGDLVFFDTSKERRGYVNHVGIYIGNGKFLHASSAKKRVVISKLDKTFYGKRFKVARRP